MPDLRENTNLFTLFYFIFTLYLLSSKYISETIHPEQRLLWFPYQYQISVYKHKKVN